MPKKSYAALLDEVRALREQSTSAPVRITGLLKDIIRHPDDPKLVKMWAEQALGRL